ncbi:MAG: carboxymuconolactone decarboxylase family protein [Rhodospirillaceae bacterium]|nr:carboxymuconolactone decarboxylase family protein [Rhodospirillaceae bacterium]
MSQEQYDAGLRERRDVLGADYVDKAIANADSFNSEFQRMVTEYCWGGTWGRGVLSRRDRSLLNLVILSALNRPHEFKIHMRGALTNGVPLDEIREALHVVAVYAGIPAGVEAFRLAREVLDEKGIKPPK